MLLWNWCQGLQMPGIATLPNAFPHLPPRHVQKYRTLSEITNTWWKLKNLCFRPNSDDDNFMLFRKGPSSKTGYTTGATCQAIRMHTHIDGEISCTSFSALSQDRRNTVLLIPSAIAAEIHCRWLCPQSVLARIRNKLLGGCRVRSARSKFVVMAIGAMDGANSTITIPFCPEHQMRCVI